LIFSSLDPETNWSTLYVRFFFLISKKVLITPLQLVFLLESFSVQLSRCRQLRCISFCFRFQNCFETVQFSLSRTLKTIQNFSSQIQQISSLTLCVLLLILRFLLQLLTFVSLAVL